MTIGYGGAIEQFPRVQWAKIDLQSRSHSGKFHAWLPWGAACGRGEKSSSRVRDRAPVNSCKTCLERVVG